MQMIAMLNYNPQDLLECIRKTVLQPIRIMEVCGTHTMAIARTGLKQLLPETVTLLSGPGCPVCVTDENDIDLVCELAHRPNIIIATYGDMMRVPGGAGSLMSAKSRGADVRVIYSSLDALRLAKNNPNREIVFVGVGFETTIATTAVALEVAIQNQISNFSIFSLHKAVAPVLQYLLSDEAVAVDGFLLPGHVCTIIGTAPFDFIVHEYLRPCVAAGFEAGDILEAIYMLLAQKYREQVQMQIQYQRAVQPQGNITACRYIDQYFDLHECTWRGIGQILGSGYMLKDGYSNWEARRRFCLESHFLSKSRCVCTEILKGQKQPGQCEYFSKECTPLHPVGPCMVSDEGSCAAYYRYSYQWRGEGYGGNA